MSSWNTTACQSNVLVKQQICSYHYIYICSTMGWNSFGEKRKHHWLTVSWVGCIQVSTLNLMTPLPPLTIKYLELAFFNQEDDFKWFFLLERHSSVFLFCLPMSVLHCVTNDTALADPGVEVKGDICSIPSPTLKVDAKSNMVKFILDRFSIVW